MSTENYLCFIFTRFDIVLVNGDVLVTIRTFVFVSKAKGVHHFVSDGILVNTTFTEGNHMRVSLKTPGSTNARKTTTQ